MDTTLLATQSIPSVPRRTSAPRETSRIEQVAFALVQGHRVYATGLADVCLAILGREVYSPGEGRVFEREIVKAARSRTVPTGEVFGVVGIGRFVVHSETLTFEIETPQSAAPAANILQQKKGPSMNATLILISIDGEDPSWIGTLDLGSLSPIVGDLVDFGVQDDALFTVKGRTVHAACAPTFLEIVVEMSPKLTREQRRQMVRRYSPPFQPPPGFTKI